MIRDYSGWALFFLFIFFFFLKEFLGLPTTLDLIDVPSYTEYYSTDEVKYDASQSSTNFKITTISNSPNRAHELNRAILDTILNRHNNMILQAMEPLDSAIKFLSTQNCIIWVYSAVFLS